MQANLTLYWLETLVDIFSQGVMLISNSPHFSIAIHPDQTTAASGQVAGHEKKQGKVSLRKHNRKRNKVRISGYLMIIKS